MLNKRLIVALLAIVLLFLGIFSFAQGNTDDDKNGNKKNEEEVSGEVNTPVITLTGSNEVTINVGKAYTDAGATATDKQDGDLTDDIVTSNPVNINVTGDYTVTYNVKDSDKNDATEVTRLVHVVDRTRPVITLSGDDEITIEVGSTYTDAGATARDNYDGVITNKITTVNNVNANVLGTYTVIYNVTDASLNRALAVTRTINVVDETAPVITITGDKTVTVELGNTYTDQGATALDNYDKDITAKITSISNVNTKVVGNYAVTYNVVDNQGNHAVAVVRTVKVNDTTAPTATVSYDVTALTNGNVVATINPSEEVTVTNNEGSLSYTFEENGEFTFEFKDGAGNPGSVTAKVNYIDKTAPVGSVHYSTTEPTNGHVYVTLTTNEPIKYIYGWYKVSSTKFVKEYYSNTNTVVNFEDLAGNPGSANVVINNIDRIHPTGTITYSNTELTNDDVLVTLTTSEPVKNIYGWTKVTSTKFTKVYHSNTNTVVNFEDLADNDGYANIIIRNIDKTDPEGQVRYSTTEPTNGNVIATLTTTEAVKDITGWTKVTSTKFTKEFTSNTSTYVYFEDLAGNDGKEAISIHNIDKTAPTGQVSYSTKELTNDDVYVTIITSESVQSISGWSKISSTKYIKKYEANTEGNVIVTFKDYAGNQGSVIVTISNIDKTHPTGVVSYSTTEPTNGDVTVTLKTSESVKSIYGWAKVSSSEYTKVYHSNTSSDITVTFEDYADNHGTAIVAIHNIDKVAPTATVSYDVTTLTNGNVVATINPSENVTVTNNEGSLSYTFEENGTFTFEFKDAAGNTGSVTASVGNIERVKPIIKLTNTNGDAIVDGAIVNQTNGVNTFIDDANPYEFYMNGTAHQSYTNMQYFGLWWLSDGVYTFTAKDKAGNVSDPITITLDSVSPTATVSYDVTALTNGNVVATITPSENVTVTNNEGSLSYTFENNGEFTFEFKDAAGNTGSVTASVGNIERVKPIIKLTNTNGDAIVNGAIVNQTNGVNTFIDEANPYEFYMNGTAHQSYTNMQYFSISWLSDGVYTFTAKDKAGNVSDPITITLDSVNPTAGLAYAPTTITNGKVVVTLTASEAIKDIADWTKVDARTFTKEYSANVASEAVNFEDLAGNHGNVTVTISNIDKINPTGTVTYSTTSWTKNNVVITLQTSEAIKDMAGWTKVNATKFTKEYSANVTNGTVNFEDLAGNAGLVTVNISNIDKSAPIITVTPLTVTIYKGGSYTDMSGVAASDNGGSGIQGLVSSSYNSSIKNTVGTYTITYTASDVVGNVGTATRTLVVKALPQQYTFHATDDDDNYSYTQGATKVQVSKDSSDKRDLTVTITTAGKKIGTPEFKQDDNNYYGFSSFDDYQYNEYSGTTYIKSFSEYSYEDKITVYFQDVDGNEYLIMINL